MQVPPARTPAQRKADTLAKLREHEADVWIASAAGGEAGAAPYLVPLSLAWIDERVVIALEGGSRTARNILESGVARLGLGPTRDVVLIDAELERAIPADQAAPDLPDRYAAQAGWDPRRAATPAAGAHGGYTYLVLRPNRIQAWREANELPGRMLMRDGRWLV